MYALMATMQTKFKDVIHRRHRIQLPGPHEVVSACTPSTHTKDSRPLGLTLPRLYHTAYSLLRHQNKTHVNRLNTMATRFQPDIKD